MESENSFDWPDHWEVAIPAIRHLALSICYKGGLSSADTEDLSQIALLRLVIEAANRKRQFASVALLCGWFSRYLRSQIKERREGQERERAAPDVDAASAATGVSGELSISDYLELIDDPRQKQVLRHRYVEGLKFAEIAARLGLSLTLAHNLHDAALALLRRRLSQ